MAVHGETVAGNHSTVAERAELKRILQEREVAPMLGVSVTHLRRLRRAGQAPRHVALGSRLLGYQLGDVLAWLDERRSM